MPHGKYYQPATALVFAGSLLTVFCLMVLIFSVDALPLRSLPAVVADAVCLQHHLRVPSPGPCPATDSTVVRQGSGSFALLSFPYVVYYAAIAFTASGRLISRSILSGSYFCPVLRIVKITRSSLHDITTNDCIFFSGLSALLV